MEIRANNLINDKSAKTPLKDAFLLSCQNFDSINGGFGTLPKFPSTHKLMFLSRFGLNENMINPLEMVEKTLNSMYKGGIYDHIGYGFFSHSIDETWLIPHFEKTLYDNALLLITYLEGYELTHKPLYKKICENTFNYILEQMTSPEGGFYYSEATDIEYNNYLFTYSEIITLLGAADGNYFTSYYSITPEGNFEGLNILNLIDNYSFFEENKKIDSLRKKVLNYRNSRNSLKIDYTILTSCNSLMIVALAKAYKVLGDYKYILAAQKALTFINENLRDNKGRLLQKYAGGESSFSASLNDYSYFIWSQIELYNSTLDIKYLANALHLNTEMINLFWDKKNYGFFFNEYDSDSLSTTNKNICDYTIPSGNSVAAYNLVKLYKLTGDKKLEEFAIKQFTAFYEIVKDTPSDFYFYILSLMGMLYPSQELVVVTKDISDITNLKNIINNKFNPNLSVIVKTIENKNELETLLPISKNYSIQNDKTTYYLCTNGYCSYHSNKINEISII